VFDNKTEFQKRFIIGGFPVYKTGVNFSFELKLTRIPAYLENVFLSETGWYEEKSSPMFFFVLIEVLKLMYRRCMPS
jgi:hypothetical protein